MKTWIKRLVSIAFLMLIAGGFFFALKPKPVWVDSAELVIGPMNVTIDEEGITRVQNVYTLSSPIAGHLDRTALQPGDTVIAGQSVVASIHPLDPPFLDRRAQMELNAAIVAAQSAVTLAQSERKQVDAALALTRAEYKRASDLSASSSISQSAFERAWSDMQLQKAQLESADATILLRQAELASVEARMVQPGASDNGTLPADNCCVDIIAPTSGVVLSMVTRSEQAVNIGTVIAEIGDPQKLEIKVDLLSRDAVRVKVGASVLINDWGGDGTLSGKITRIEPAAFTRTSALGIEEQRVNVILSLDGQVPAELGHGYRVFARLSVWSAADALQVPISAMFRHNSSWAIFKLTEEGTAQLRNISIGHMNTTHAEILDGFNVGEKVILYPSDQITDGALVRERIELTES